MIALSMHWKKGILHITLQHHFGILCIVVNFISFTLQVLDLIKPTIK